MQRHSKQREVILRNLKSRCDHPTAEMVYTAVREEMPNISLGTVYRNLNGLSEEREILCFTINGKDHFDAKAHAHVHMVCNACGSIEDYEVDVKAMESLAPNFSEVSNVIVQGKCKMCG